MLGNRRKSINFALPQWNNGEEHWNSVVCNSWTMDIAALQYSENHLVTTIHPGSTGVTKRSIRPTNSSENYWFSEVFLFTPIPNRRRILKLRVCKKVAIKIAPCFATSKGSISLFFKDIRRIKPLGICHLARWLQVAKGSPELQWIQADEASLKHRCRHF